MITNKELNEVSLSATKKDYYQIWNELIDLATKISNRWTPDTTNESDPGVVLLKALTAIADKLNYNIDKNTLEAFMPSATQVESMRKLTEMLGYNMHYYRAATCDVSIGLKSSAEAILGDTDGVIFPKFVNLKNEEEDVNYVTLESFVLQKADPLQKVPAIEGELIECESNTDNIISMAQLDDNNRYLLPEAGVAENGIFVYNVTEGSEEQLWEQVDNINVLLPGTRAFKFGFDSISGLPYLQFPEDISQTIKDGLRIQYIRTNGLNGNIAGNILSKLITPAIWETANDDDVVKKLTADDFTVSNIIPATNGADPETLNAAYNNFKKTIGTFDTLVTCRDYMNKIYQLTKSKTDTTPLVSNIVVSDIRDDINKATTLCSFNEYGICYKDYSFKSGDDNLIDHFDLMLYPFTTVYGLNTIAEYKNSFKYTAGNVSLIKQDLENVKTIAHNFRSPARQEIACVKNYLKLRAKIVTTKKIRATEGEEILKKVYTAIYKNFNSRKLDFGEEILADQIKAVIKNADPLIKDLNWEDPLLYTSISLVNGEEYTLVATDGTGREKELSRGDSLYNNLALRNILAGRIAAFSYDDEFATGYDEKPYGHGKRWSDETEAEYRTTYPRSVNTYLGKMVSEFKVDSTRLNAIANTGTGKTKTEDGRKLRTEGLELDDNEVIQFRSPNIQTVHTYPCYTNYFLQLDMSEADEFKRIAVPATFYVLYDFMNTETTTSNLDEVEVDTMANRGIGKITAHTDVENEETFDTLKNTYVTLLKGVTSGDKTTYYLVDEYDATIHTYYHLTFTRWNEFVFLADTCSLMSIDEDISKDNFKRKLEFYGRIFKKVSDYFIEVSEFSDDIAEYWVYKIKTETFSNLHTNYLHHLIINDIQLDGLYRSLGVDVSKQYGEYIDRFNVEYMLATSFTSASTASPLTYYYVQQTHHIDPTPEDPNPTYTKDYTKNGLGKNANYKGISMDEDYQLQANEFLLINYTDSTKDSADNEVKTVHNVFYGPGKIIKPNFKLIDSKLYANNHSYPKKEGFYFVEATSCPGMFTLGANEQLEIREFVKVELKNETSYFYWSLKSIGPKDTTSVFTFDEYYGTHEVGAAPNAYTLKDGELFCYTDAQKNSFAWYGAGTIIVRSPNTPLLRREIDEEATVSDDDVMSYGLASWIPWSDPVNLAGDDGGATEKLIIVENRYVSLTKGDFLQAISQGSEPSDTRLFGVDLDNTWKKIGYAKYKLAEDESPSTLPIISIEGFSWEARSRLDFNMGPNLTQTLHAGDSITLTFYDKLTNKAVDSEKLEPLYQVDSIPEGKTLEADYYVTPLGIYSNYICQGAMDTLDVAGNNIEGLGKDLDFRVKTLKREVPKYLYNSTNHNNITLNNYVNGDTKYTNFAFASLKDIKDCMYDETTVEGEIVKVRRTTPREIFNLNINITENTRYGLVMFNYTDEFYEPDFLSPEKRDESHYPVRIAASYSEAGHGIRLFNSGESEYQGSIYLKPGINVIEVSPKVTQLTIYPDYEKLEDNTARECQSVICYSGLSLVKGINERLDYRYVRSGEVTDQNDAALNKLLSDIAATQLGDMFYYNNPIDKNMAINFNDNLASEKLVSPNIWYDTNNINNKFVISEIDADDLEKGVIIAPSSRL